jgi:DNA-binding NarL/FixJ family response regulator
VGEAESGEHAVGIAQDLQPDLILLDRVMPGTNISETIQSIKRVAPDTRILMLTGTKLDSQVMKLLSEGLDGYVLKDVEPNELKQAIRSITHGEAYLQPSVARHMIDSLITSAQIAEQNLLTARELEVLNCMATSATYREIAAQLFISEETVRSHAKHILSKLGQPNRDAAVQEALRLGLLTKPEI